MVFIQREFKGTSAHIEFIFVVAIIMVVDADEQQIEIGFLWQTVFLVLIWSNWLQSQLNQSICVSVFAASETSRVLVRENVACARGDFFAHSRRDTYSGYIELYDWLLLDVVIRLQGFLFLGPFLYCRLEYSHVWLLVYERKFYVYISVF